MLVMDQETRDYFLDELAEGLMVRLVYRGPGWAAGGIALVLDEPVEGDVRYDVQGVRVVMDPETARVVENTDVVTIYSTTFGPKARLENDCSGPWIIASETIAPVQPVPLQDASFEAR